ncbi:polysaccharide biosynthesis/export family protein [Thermodesulfobacteriota bacterium]
MKNYLIIVSFLLIGLLPSCAQQIDVVSEVEPVATLEGMESQEKESYRIQPGDQLEVKFYYNSDLNASVVVRSDGKIALQLVGEVQAAGLTLTELDEALTQSYGHELLNPEITININDPQGLRIYVGGEVHKQGFIGFRNNMTPLQAVLNAGGFKENADPRSTLIIRKDQNNKPVSILVDLAMLLAGKDNDSDYLLLPDDIVYVPKLP